MTKDPKPLPPPTFANLYEKKFPTLSGKAQPRVELAAKAIDAQQGLTPELKGFIPRPFVLFGIPHHKPKGTEYVRRNGDTEFTLVAQAKYGLPHGQDRLFPIFVGSAFAAVGMPANNTFCFRSVADVLELFGIPNKGTTNLRVRDWLRRWHHTTFYSERITVAGRRTLQESQSYRLVSRYRIWTDDHVHPNQHTLFDNVVQLDSFFADDLREHPVPVRLDVVRALKSNSNALGLALWLGYRSHTLALGNRAEVEIPIFGACGLAEQLGCSGPEKEIRRNLKAWMQAIRTTWVRCPHVLTADGNSFIVRAERGRPMELPAEFRRSVKPWVRESAPFVTPVGKPEEEGV
jgi:hypothetical protein